MIRIGKPDFEQRRIFCDHDAVEELKRCDRRSKDTEDDREEGDIMGDDDQEIILPDTGQGDQPPQYLFAIRMGILQRLFGDLKVEPSLHEARPGEFFPELHVMFRVQHNALDFGQASHDVDIIPGLAPVLNRLRGHPAAVCDRMPEKNTFAGKYLPQGFSKGPCHEDPVRSDLNGLPQAVGNSFERIPFRMPDQDNGFSGFWYPVQDVQDKIPGAHGAPPPAGWVLFSGERFMAEISRDLLTGPYRISFFPVAVSGNINVPVAGYFSPDDEGCGLTADRCKTGPGHAGPDWGCDCFFQKQELEKKTGGLLRMVRNRKQGVTDQGFTTEMG